MKLRVKHVQTRSLGALGAKLKQWYRNGTVPYKYFFFTEHLSGNPRIPAGLFFFFFFEKISNVHWDTSK